MRNKLTPRRRVRRLSTALLAVAAVLAASMLAAGCGSSSSNSTTSSSAANSGSAAGATSGGTSSTSSNSPIVVGNIGSYSGVFASSYGIMPAILKAWASSTNAAGGIDGHPVKLIIMDDAGDPATGLKDAKTLIEQDHVIAIVGEMSNTDTTWASYVASQHVPVVGGSPTNVPFLNNADFFPSGTDNITSIYGLVQFGKLEGKKHVGFMYCAEAPSCAVGVKIIGGAAKDLGVSFAYNGSVSATAPSFAAPCLAAKNAGVDMLFISDGQQVVLRIASACAALGFKPLQVSQSGAVAKTWLTNSAVNGAATAQNDFPWFESSTPATKAYQAALAKYAPGTQSSAEFGPSATYPWAGGQLFVAAAKAAKLGSNPTSAELEKGLYSLHNETLGGLTPPLTFVKGQPSPVLCYFRVDIDGGKFTAPDGLKTSCMPAADHAAALKAIE